MAEKIYNTPQEALSATDEFYWSQEGFTYAEAKVTQWIESNVRLPATGRILDLCCGDGIWSKGMQNSNPNLELFGIDISEGGIQKARRLLGTDDRHFVVGDAETELPFANGFFDLIFARGPGLYNQHCMDRPATIAVIEMWHCALQPAGQMVSIFASVPDRMGTYTPAEEVKLPYNRCPRHTPQVDFRGGKYHHSKESFLAPFEKASNVVVVDYRFGNNLHFLVTRARTGSHV